MVVLSHLVIINLYKKTYWISMYQILDEARSALRREVFGSLHNPQIESAFGMIVYIGPKMLTSLICKMLTRSTSSKKVIQWF